MANEKEKGLSKINNWVSTDLYKEARILAIQQDKDWRPVLEEALTLYINAYKKED